MTRGLNCGQQPRRSLMTGVMGWGRARTYWLARQCEALAYDGEMENTDNTGVLWEIPCNVCALQIVDQLPELKVRVSHHEWVINHAVEPRFIAGVT